MPDWTCLKLWMAVCWKVSWKVDPLPLSVPLRLLDDPPPLVVFDELQAVSDGAIAATAAPAITTPWLRTRCIFDIPSQLPAECCDEDGPDGVQAFSAWPKIMLAAGPKAPPIVSRPVARPVCSVIFRSAMALGSWNAGRRCSSLTWGLSPRCRDREALAVLAPLRAAAALMLLPHTGSASGFAGCFTGYYQRRRWSFTTSNYGHLARGQPRVF